MLVGVFHRAARRSGETDLREAGLETPEPRLEGVPAGRANEDLSVGKRDFHFPPDLRAVEGDHHPVAMKFESIGPAVDPLNVLRTQELDTVMVEGRHRITQVEGAPSFITREWVSAVLRRSRPYRQAPAGMTSSDVGTAETNRFRGFGTEAEGPPEAHLSVVH